MDITLQSDRAETASQYAVVDLTADVARSVGKVTRPSLAAAFGTGGGSSAAPIVGTGDRISVSIWESSSEGLFASPAGKSTTIPVVVGSDGRVFLPYAGSVSVAGLTLDETRDRIQSELVGKAVDPQVIVSLQENGTRTVSLVGDVGKSARIPVPDSGLRLLDAIAIAGGPREAGFDTEVSVVRDRIIGTTRFEDIARFPTNNIWLRPRDTVQLTYRPRSFTGFGAIKSSKQQPFNSDELSLAEALAQMGGLNPSFADRGGVFLFRFETADRFKRTGVSAPSTRFAAGIPTIYRLDLSDPSALFVAQSFGVQDKDMIYVATASTVEFRSFLDFVVSPFLVTGERIQDLQN